LHAKFLKEILSKKRKIDDEHEIIALGEECSAVVQNKLPAKFKDPGSFFISCLIGNVSIDRALCDLDSSVSLMPYSTFKKLDLGELRPINISLQLANRSLKYLLGILEDVPIRVGDFYVPIDFIILDMTKDGRTQIILGRSFLATMSCKIDVKEGRLTFDVGEKHVEFGLLNDFESTPTFSYCGCDVIDLVKPKHLIEMTQNELFSLNCALFEEQRLDHLKLEYLSASIVKG